jgi:hypothetical protein
MLIESLSLDVEDVRLSLARGLNFPAEHGGIQCLCIILDFIGKGDHHPLWYQDGTDEAERKRREKSFAICKAAVIKAVVEVAGEEKNEEVLWDDDEELPGGEFVCKMVDWIKAYVSKKENAMDTIPGEGRDDLVICASLSLGNLSRRGTFYPALSFNPINNPYKKNKHRHYSSLHIALHLSWLHHMSFHHQQTSSSSTA